MLGWAAVAVSWLQILGCAAGDPADSDGEASSYVREDPGGGGGAPVQGPPTPIVSSPPKANNHPPPDTGNRCGGAPCPIVSSPPKASLRLAAELDARQCATAAGVRLCVVYDAVQRTAVATAEVLSGGPTLALGLGISGVPALLASWSGTLATAQAKALEVTGLDPANFCATLAGDAGSAIGARTVCLR
jgi:hypothetical protein